MFIVQFVFLSASLSTADDDELLIDGGKNFFPPQSVAFLSTFLAAPLPPGGCNLFGREEQKIYSVFVTLGVLRMRAPSEAQFGSQ